MRITFVLPYATLSGGIRVIAMHAQGLVRRGHQVCIVSTPQSDWPLADKFRSLLRGRGWPKLPPASPSHLDGSGLPHRLTKGTPVSDADVPDADVVIATWWETAEWVAALSPAKGAKVFFIQGQESVFYKGSGPSLLRRVEATWRLPLHKITISTWLADLIRQADPRTPVALVPNAVDHQQFHAPPRPKQARPTVGMIYAPAPLKGNDLMLQAFVLAAAQLKDLHLIAFGAEPVIPGLPLPPGAEYTLRPAQERLRDLYAGCDAWLFGSRSDGFGLPILEAMACRTPVIATPVGAAAELLADGGGLLVPPEDAGAMANAMCRIGAMSLGDWQAMSEAAEATARRYTWDRSTALFESALQAAIAPARGLESPAGPQRL